MTRETKLLEIDEMESTEKFKNNVFPMDRIKRDILTIEKGIICHQVNAQGVMGAGLAAQIKMKYSQVYKDYMNVWYSNKLRLGDCIITSVGENLYVASLVGQDNYGRGQKFTSYPALTVALNNLNKFMIGSNVDLQVYFPYRMGCGLGGGSWRVVKDIIEEKFPNAIICEL